MILGYVLLFLFVFFSIGALYYVGTRKNIVFLVLASLCFIGSWYYPVDSVNIEVSTSFVGKLDGKYAFSTYRGVVLTGSKSVKTRLLKRERGIYTEKVNVYGKVIHQSIKSIPYET